MSSSWSGHRKRWYAFLAIVIVAIGVGVPSFFTFYKAPSCFDMKQNGNEGGVDCGGVCTRLCSSSFVPAPAASWVRLKEIAPNLYNIAAYLVNPNARGIARDIPYRIDMLDVQGITVNSITGTVTLPPGRNTLAFKGSVAGGKQPVARAVFKFTGEPDWYSATDPLLLFETSDKDYTEGTTSGSSLLVTFTNKSSNPISNITVYAILKDKDDNVLDFSKTILDQVLPHSTEIAPFTWPVSHNGQVISIEVLPVAQ